MLLTHGQCSASTISPVHSRQIATGERYIPTWVTFELVRVHQRGIVGDEHGAEPVGTFTDGGCLPGCYGATRASLGSMGWCGTPRSGRAWPEGPYLEVRPAVLRLASSTSILLAVEHAALEASDLGRDFTRSVQPRAAALAACAPRRCRGCSTRA